MSELIPVLLPREVVERFAGFYDIEPVGEACRQALESERELAAYPTPDYMELPPFPSIRPERENDD